MLDAQGGLPVGGATVDLDRGTTVVATTQTDASGHFQFLDQPAGTYSVVIHAAGYESGRAPEFAITAGQNEARVQTAIFRQA
ncbi:MAG: carboxypeptidase regulatory-like domain-containing protein, partial [Candidatus Eremiobacteraeota bacterium]|nr:carboxypeptidase regulatory-like domain-containing protein [Candidatus Eremiobacteraeota bacterium]